MTSAEKPVFKFGPFQADSAKRLLLREGEVVPVTSKVFDALLVLIEHRGQVVEKDVLLSHLWPDTIVEEKNLTVNISALRKALGENPQDHHYIVTAPGRGYTFVAEVAEAGRQPDVIVQNQVTTSVTFDEETPSRVWLWIGVALLAAAVGATAAFFWQSRHADSRPGTIAVLPFKPLTGDSIDPHIQMGIADALIGRLGRLPQLVVRPISAVRRYVGQDQDPLAAGKSLQVESVLDGSIHRVGGRVRVTAQLFSVRTGKMQWSEEFDVDAADPFAIQDSISLRMGKALALRLSADEQNRLTRHETDNVEAYTAYVQGRFEATLNTRVGLRASLEHFQRATQLDPNYALAYAGLADTLLWYGTDYGAPNEFMPRAESAARHALSLDPEIPGARAALGTILYRYRYNWTAAEDELRRAIQQNPNDPYSHHKYGWYLAVQGRIEDAKRETAQAAELAPFSPMIRADVGLPFYCARQFDYALSSLPPLIESYPKFSTAYLDFAFNYIAQHRWQEAIDVIHKGAAFDDSPEFLSALGISYARMGPRQEADHCIAKMEALKTSRYVSPVSVGLIHLALGDRDTAMKLLEQGYDDHSWWMIFLKIDPRFDDLRTDPRFQHLMKRVGL